MTVTKPTSERKWSLTFIVQADSISELSGAFKNMYHRVDVGLLPLHGSSDHEDTYDYQYDLSLSEAYMAGLVSSVADC